MSRKAKRREYQRLLDNLRMIARREEKDWEEKDWRRALLRATAGKPGDFRPARNLRPGWAWAYAAVLVVLIGAAAVAARNFFQEAWPTLVATVEPGRSGTFATGGVVGSLARQNQLAMTLVSGESGLRVHWYFDKEFDWEEEP